MALVLAAMGWVSHSALDLERAEIQGREQAAFEENIRLALWRMDSAMAPLVAKENARPYFAFSAFYPAERAYTNMFAEIEKGEVLVPSPLLTFESPYVKLHFQFEPGGALSSPQAPVGNMRDRAESGYCSTIRVSAQDALLAELNTVLDREMLLGCVPVPPKNSIPLLSTVNQLQHKKEQQIASNWGQRASPQSQQEMNDKEAVQRKQAYDMANQGQQSVHVANSTPALDGEEVGMGALTPVWLGERLLLVRRVIVGPRSFVQGCWIDWPKLETFLRESVSDLLPDANLVREGACAEARATRQLASLPVYLVASAEPLEELPLLSPIRLALLAAWFCGALAVCACGALIWGALSLSERRGAFVSAVTHELRTPLTTFRLYTEMLAADMITDETRRREYLNTLHAESERLGHLVENVLAYAGLERGRFGARLEKIHVKEVLETMRARLDLRAGQAALRVVIVEGPSAGEVRVMADASAVERILFNLVDNACKYARNAREPVIHIEMEVREGVVLLRVRDGGPGLSAEGLRKLFRPFSKSAKEAAHSAPGVGLGLSLCRRLARAMGGDLRYSGSASGACFDLELCAVKDA